MSLELKHTAPQEQAPLSADDLCRVLDVTIKHDIENKLATFLCQLSAYTDNAQFNISFNAPSSTGKSYVPTEIARLFPQEDILEIAYCSPTAFFHDAGQFDKKTNLYTVDLSRKVIIFLDQPHNDLLARLRPLLSHDKKEIILKITDKNQKFGMRTKNVLMRGYPSVVFCTAGLQIDEQEATRFLLLSPEVTQGKLRSAISQSIRKEADAHAYGEELRENSGRTLLMERIRAIKEAHIGEIKVAGADEIESRFLAGHRLLKPRHQRDIKRLFSLIKSFALLNFWWRDFEGTTIKANEDDARAAFSLWERISKSQELNIPPYVLRFYEEVLLPLWEKKRSRSDGEFLYPHGGVSRQEVMLAHHRVYGRVLTLDHLRMQLLPMLESSGLVMQEHDPIDRRNRLICPVTDAKTPTENSGDEGGVIPAVMGNQT